jgi:hypothetical protein
VTQLPVSRFLAPGGELRGSLASRFWIFCQISLEISSRRERAGRVGLSRTRVSRARRCLGSEPPERTTLRNSHLLNYGAGVRPCPVSSSAIWINRRSVEDASSETKEAESGPIRLHRRRPRYLPPSRMGKDRSANHRRPLGGVGTSAQLHPRDVGPTNTHRVRHSRLAAYSSPDIRAE